MSFGAETRAATAKAAVAANADAMRKILNALRQAGGRELATQWVSVYPTTDETGTVNGYAASNSVSAVSDVGDAPALIDAAAEAGANQISGPGLSSSNAEVLYRQALGNAVDDARLNAQALAKAAGRSLGPITTIVEGGVSGGPEPLYRAEAQAADSATPIVPGEQETSATVSVTFYPPLTCAQDRDPRARIPVARRSLKAAAVAAACARRDAPPSGRRRLCDVVPLSLPLLARTRSSR